MTLRIRTLLPLIVCALALMAVAFAGLDARDAWIGRQHSTEFANVNRISQALLRSAGQWATERGISNATLKAPDAASAARRAEIVALRGSADDAFRQALQGVREVPQMKAGAAAVGAAEQAYQSLQVIRAAIDDNIAKPASARAPETVQGAFGAITKVIGVAAVGLRQTLETLTDPPSAKLAQLLPLRHLAAEMAEYAGRERGYLSGILGARIKLGGEQLRNLSMYRGHIDLAWNMIAAQKQRSDLPPNNRGGRRGGGPGLFPNLRRDP
jgi:methyl-accepting chemotaxis protein